MTDTEIICDWMEPEWETMDKYDFRWHGARLDGGEWTPFAPETLSLDELWKVEHQLSGLQRIAYSNRLDAQMAVGQWIWHATAEQKIKALAAVLRQTSVRRHQDASHDVEVPRPIEV